MIKGGKWELSDFRVRRDNGERQEVTEPGVKHITVETLCLTLSLDTELGWTGA